MQVFLLLRCSLFKSPLYLTFGYGSLEEIKYLNNFKCNYQDSKRCVRVGIDIRMSGLVDLEHRRRHSLDPSQEKFGIPQHFGMYYAMGTGLIIEGELSKMYRNTRHQKSGYIQNPDH